MASLFWHLNVVKLLCENRAEINTIAASERLTPLHAASTSCQEEVVKLLSQGAINAFREMADDFPVEPFSPLIESASPDGRLEVTKLLCEKGAEIKAVDSKGFTPLHLMSMSGYLEYSLWPNCSFILLTNGDTSSRDPSAANLPDRYGSTCLSADERKGHIGVVNSLLDAVAKMFPDSFDRMPLCWARRHGHTATSQLLLEHAETNGITPRPEMVLEASTRTHGLLDKICDVCTFNIPSDGVYHRCSICNGRDFEIWRDCFTRNARCLQPLHKLVKMYHSGGSKDNEYNG
ncbi:ankyrin [Colletotrichum eremochloae]|nr:ankyrin [Colletotrichum eremochloae]